MRLTSGLFKSTLVIIAITLTHTTFAPALAQDLKKAPSKSQSQTATRKSDASKTQAAPVDFVDADKFISKITSLAEPKPRGEFETKEAYEARQPKLAGTESVLVRVERGYKDYSYDIDSQTLSIRIPVSEIKPRKALQGLPLRVAHKVDKEEKYTGSNAYGARVTVERRWSTQYLLFVPTDQLKDLVTVTADPAFASLPESVRSKYNKTTFALKLSAEPGDAERISKDYSLLLLVRPRGLQHTVHEASHSTKPTISDPTEITLFTAAAEVDLMEIVIRDGKTGKTLLKKAVFGAAPPPITESSVNVSTESAKKVE